MTTVPVPSAAREEATPPTLVAVRHRRINRAWETSPEAVKKAIPKGSVRAGHTWQVHRALREDRAYSIMNRNRRRSLALILDLLGSVADYETMTARPTWAWLTASSGLSRSTIARHLKTLREMGLLGIVATGRTAQYAAPGPDGERINEAAVYVLTYPNAIAAVRQALGGGDILDTPPPLSGTGPIEEELTTHARGGKAQADGAARRRNAQGGSAADTPAPAHRPIDHWPAHRTAATKCQRLAAARQVQLGVWGLRCMSPADVASCLRDFMLDGWTVADVIHALTHHPEAGSHALDALGLGETASRARGWLTWRLGAWRGADGTPMRSRSQRVAAEQKLLHAQRRAEHERIAAERAVLKQGLSPTARAELAKMRAMWAK